MPQFRYLIVGGGMTADAAIAGIREIDTDTPVCVIGLEPVLPYDRPPLSKALWKGTPRDAVWRKTDHRNVEFLLARRVQQLDPSTRSVSDDQGDVHTADRLLLATGGGPKRLSDDGDSVIYFRTLADYDRLHALAPGGARIVVIGGGFIGSEIAAALTITGNRVTMVLPESAIGAKVYPGDLAKFVTDYYREKGVDILTAAKVVGVRRSNGGAIVRIAQAGETRDLPLADCVVAGIGIEPSTDLARAAGLSVDNGIVVDRGLRTSAPDIFAAGDVAAFYNPALDRRIRVEHEDNANTMGKAAGRAMAGASVSYDHLPFFYSDLFELGYEAVGDLNARHETLADWKTPYGEGVVYYLEGQRVRGVLLWNTWGQVDAARRLIAEPGPFRAADLKGRLPETK
jgi:NADPH-dependent 2,4-dienoyl-CoA reductase/sulfur reductase-like enzyme